MENGERSWESGVSSQEFGEWRVESGGIFISKDILNLFGFFSNYVDWVKSRWTLRK